jgi:twitching motility protein PilT
VAEVIIGMGGLSSAREVVRIAEEQLRKTEGAPLRVLARATGIEIVANRSDFEGAFESFLLRTQLSGSDLEALVKSAEDLGDVCSVSENEGWHELLCAASDGHSVSETEEAVDTLSELAAMPEVWRVHGEEYRVDPISVELLFKAMVQYKASDVHLAPGKSPVFRVDGQARESELLGVLSAQQILSLIREIASDLYWEEFERDKQTSFNFHQAGLGYSRVSTFIKAGAPHCTFRFLPEVIPSFEDLGIAEATMIKLADLHHGLVLVTGMTGSGKSTTVASLVDWINTNKTLHILTIENPVEYVHMNKMAMISQRTTGTDVASFNDAVTGALRHDPDVIMIGEMRDPDTIRSAINAAATGHLVISTLHANTASGVINRIVSFFDPVERDLVKLQLRDCIQCIVCQRLVPKIGSGRLPALEILYNDIKPITDAIVMGDTDGIRIGMQQTISHSFLFEEYLYNMYKEKKIDLEQARHFTTDVSVLDQMLMGTYSVPRLDAIKNAGAGH